ncbi:hypothetical protein ACO0K2_17470 [Undibacterium sp. MH2W]|uniref:hypothetical protein n=1 Tax=Undibacterium sp. MH2W TaxID=3413044 RepID=UPI003BF0B868
MMIKGTVLDLAGTQRGSLMLWQATAQDASNCSSQIALGTSLVQQLKYNPYTGRLDTGLLVQSGSNLVRLQEGNQYDSLGNVLHRKTKFQRIRTSHDERTICSLMRTLPEQTVIRPSLVLITLM